MLEAAPHQHGRRADAYVEIGTTQLNIELAVEIRPQIRRAQLGAIQAQLQQFECPGLLITDHVNPRLAEELERRDIFFVDTAGNAFLRGEGFLVRVTGKRDALKTPTTRETRMGLKPTGLRVIFTLLCNPHLVEENYRTLAATAGVALGAVPGIMRDLQERGYIIQRGRRERRLVGLEELLDEWTLGYARTLKKRLLLGRFDTTTFNEWRKINLRTYHAVWGGEPGAALVTHYLRPATLTLWVDTIAPRLQAKMRLKPAEEGRVEILRRFWHPEVGSAPQGQDALQAGTKHGDVAPLVLIYADLLTIGDARAVETAKMLRTEWIDGAFERYRARTAR